MGSGLIDVSMPFGERVSRRLREEKVIWLTTVGTDGTPQPNPVWFSWDGETFLVYNLPSAKRLAHIRRNPRIALHFDGNGRGGDIVVFAGEARVSDHEPPSDQNPEYMKKYGQMIVNIGHDAADFAAAYSVPLRITPTKVRGH